MVAIRPLEEIADKYKRVTPGRADEYKRGVEAPLEDWASEAAKAEPAWIDGIQDAIGRKAFSAGVKRAGTAKWQKRALEKGVGRYPEGVRIGAEEYPEDFAPYHEVIARLTLPERGRRGDPKNIERVRIIADALHKKRMELLKGGS